MTTSTQDFGSPRPQHAVTRPPRRRFRRRWRRHTPPAAPGAPAPASAIPLDTERAPRNGPPAASPAAAACSQRRWPPQRLRCAVVLLATGVFKSGSTVSGIHAKPTARADAQAQAGLGQPGTLSVSGAAPFVLHYPSDWTPLTARQLARIANPPAAGLLAEGGKVLLLVRPKSPLTGSVATLSAQLTRSLSSRFADFRLLSTGTTTTLAGPAWVYTFERTGHGLVQSEVVISTARAAYEIDIALRGGANRAAREMGEIVHSFQT